MTVMNYEDSKIDNYTKPVWNVIEENEFKKRITDVFDMVSNALTKSLGPYGSTTIIEQYGEMHITKDGWNVLKNIRFKDVIDQNIHALLLRISAQVVIKVGDGSTSAIVAANNILKELEKHSNLFKDIRPKDLMSMMNECTETIIKYIIKRAYIIDKNSDLDKIYKLAFISTNGDSEISEIITDIYRETGNPAIEYVASKTGDTKYDIIKEGYRGDITYLDTIFVNKDDGICSVAKPIILMFDHKLDMEVSLPIIAEAVGIALDKKTRLVVIAPNYDKMLLDYIRKNINIEFKSTGTSSIVYCRASLVSNMSHELYNDFAVMAGAEIIREQFLDDFDPKTVSEYIGSVDEINIGPKNTFISGFTNRNATMYEKILLDAETKYNEKLQENEKNAIVDLKLNEYKQRFTKLKGSMGIIHVGGASSLEKKANMDLVDDAVKACESAFYNGYNCGGNLIIPYVIKNDILGCDISDDTLTYDMPDTKRFMYQIISDAFKNVFLSVLSNKYAPASQGDPDEKTLDYMENIVDSCFNGDRELLCYDLIEEKYSTDVINSCLTDIEILKASVSIVSLLLSSNQYITIETK